jgi:hypothetical protein
MLGFRVRLLTSGPGMTYGKGTPVFPRSERRSSWRDSICLFDGPETYVGTLLWLSV